MNLEWKTYHPEGKLRVIVTKSLPGQKWLDILTHAGCRVDVCMDSKILNIDDIKTAIGDKCDGAIGQLTEDWNDGVLASLKAAEGKVYSNYAVGYDNVDVEAATRYQIAVGNTPGVLTETTAELTVALTFAAIRRIVEADRFMRTGTFKGWLPNLFLGERLYQKTLGVIGIGRIGMAYAKMMIEGFKMNLLYFDPEQNQALEDYVAKYNQFLASQNRTMITIRKVSDMDELIQNADVISLHPPLNNTTYHLINAERLEIMKPDAVLINVSRGAVIDEQALVAHCQKYPAFRVGLDVFENEPDLTAELDTLDNVVIVPHIGSASKWTREGMAIIAAYNIVGILQRKPLWKKSNMLPFLDDDPPEAIPSIINHS